MADLGKKLALEVMLRMVWLKNMERLGLRALCVSESDMERMRRELVRRIQDESLKDLEGSLLQNKMTRRVKKVEGGES